MNEAIRENHVKETLTLTFGPGIVLASLADKLSELAGERWEIASFTPEYGDSQRDGRYATGNVAMTLQRDARPL